MTGLVVILLLVLAVYGQTVAFPFHFDDQAILADPAITSPDGWWRVFRPLQTRPLTYFTFWLNYRLGGFHAVNVALHAAAVVAAYTAFRRAIDGRAALVAVALFALHPLQTEAVCYVFARATVLATLFCLLAWRAWDADRRRLALALFCLALLAKEEAVAFPVLLWVVARSKPRPWSMLAASVLAGTRLLWVVARTPGAGLTPLPSAQYLLLQPISILKYLQIFVLPLGQNFDHHISSPSVAATLGFAVLVAVLAAARPAGSRWLLGALVLLAPTSSVFPLSDAAYEHRMYLPLIGLSLAAGLWLSRAPRPIQAAVVLALAATSFARARVWRSEEALWTDAAAKSPHKFRPKIQLARTLYRSDPERAETLLLEARKIEPRNPESYTQMGTLMLEQRNPYGALGEFEEALRLAPNADTLSNRGIALFLLGRSGEAEADFRKALERNRCHPNARHNLGLLQQHRGQTVRLPDCPEGFTSTPPTAR